MREAEPVGPRLPTEPEVPRYARLPLLGAWAKFSVKLFLDSLLDLLLMPAAFVAVALGILRGGDEPDRYFRALMHFGRRVEHYVNLFGNRRSGSVDDVLGDYEQQVASVFEQRGWSQKAEAVLRMPDRSTPPAARPAPAANAAGDTANPASPPSSAGAAEPARAVDVPAQPPPPPFTARTRDDNDGPARGPS